MKELPNGFRPIEELTRYAARSSNELDADTVGIQKNTPYLASTVFNIGPGLQRRAGLKPGDSLDVFVRGRGILIRKGSTRKALKCGRQLRVTCPGIWEVGTGVRVNGSADDGQIFFLMPEEIRKNPRIAK